MDIQRILIFSQSHELYYFIAKRYASAFAVERRGSWYEWRNGLIEIIPENTALVVMDMQGDFGIAEEYTRKIRMGGFAGNLLLISREEKRQRKMEEKISAIDAGADEYLGYPQTNEEIAASIKALLRHYGRKEKLEFQIGGKSFFMNPQARKVMMNQKDLTFTKTEYAIFHYLLFRLNRSVSHKELYEAVWKKEYMHDDMNIMAHVHRMRKKMGDDMKDPRYIQNVYGIGYMVEGVQ